MFEAACESERVEMGERRRGGRVQREGGKQIEGGREGGRQIEGEREREREREREGERGGGRERGRERWRETFIEGGQKRGGGEVTSAGTLIQIVY